MLLASIAFLVLLMNVPFGYWRAGTKTFSLQWFLAVHSPVPLIILLRIYSGLGWQIITFPVIIGSFFFGQYLGARIRKYRTPADE